MMVIFEHDERKHEYTASKDERQRKGSITTYARHYHRKHLQNCNANTDSKVHCIDRQDFFPFHPLISFTVR